MKPTVYTVHAYRWGNRENHSYSVGVFGKKHAALKAAETEEDYRGGKYECEVLEWTLDSGIAGSHDNGAKVIKALPAVDRLRAHNHLNSGERSESAALTCYALRRKEKKMKDLNEMYLDVLARDLAPMPWVLDQCNEKGVCVKDSRGEDLYFEDFGGIPDEMSSGQREHIVERAKLFAQWLVAFSNDRVGA